MQRPKPYRILISGGGTGGHVFPAIAIANTLKQMDERTEILFVGASDRLEMTKVPEAGYRIEGLWISGFQRSQLWKNVLLPFKVLFSLLKANSIINRFKPDVAVGVGGYASGPTLYMANMRGVPTLVQEQNSFAGMTNKLMAQKAKRFCVAYDNMEQFFPKSKIVKTGNPVRREIAYLKSDKPAAYQHFGLDPNKKTILIIGGSLGARTINESIKAGLDKIDEITQVLWQTGKHYFEDMQQVAKDHHHVHAMAFIKEMNYAYDVADVIISRAGALSIAELCLVNKPVILVPSPNVAEDHQTKNALALVDKDAAILVKDNEAMAKLVDEVMALLADENRQQILSKNIAELGIRDAAERIAKEVLALAG